MSYVTEKKLTKHPEEFGHGAIEGVAGPEAANNASAAGTLVPMLSLGLPTNATAAVMLAAMTGYGIQPGPGLFASNGDLVWALIASLFIGNALLLLLNLPLAPLWARLLRTPRPYLYAGILFFAIIGVILGPRLEIQLRQALQLADGSWGTLFSEPVAVVAYLVIAVLFLMPLLQRLFRRTPKET